MELRPSRGGDRRALASSPPEGPLPWVPDGRDSPRFFLGLSPLREEGGRAQGLQGARVRARRTPSADGQPSSGWIHRSDPAVPYIRAGTSRAFPLERISQRGGGHVPRDLPGGRHIEKIQPVLEPASAPARALYGSPFARGEAPWAGSGTSACASPRRFPGALPRPERTPRSGDTAEKRARKQPIYQLVNRTDPTEGSGDRTDPTEGSGGRIWVPGDPVDPLLHSGWHQLDKVGQKNFTQGRGDFSPGPPGLPRLPGILTPRAELCYPMQSALPSALTGRRSPWSSGPP